MQYQNQDESGEKDTAVRLNKETALPTTAIPWCPAAEPITSTRFFRD